MTPVELAAAAVECIAAGRRDVQLVVPREPRGDRVRLFGPRGPLSTEIACVREGETVAWFNAVKVVGWLVEHGLVRIETREGNRVAIVALGEEE